jgi:hypothetical protein
MSAADHSNFSDPKRRATMRVCMPSDGFSLMVAHAKDWKREVDRLWASTALDYAQAARLAAEIARCHDLTLQQAAAQALPSLRQASLKNADRGAKAIAHRRLGLLRNALHALDGPRFGKRHAAH